MLWHPIGFFFSFFKSFSSFSTKKIEKKGMLGNRSLTEEQTLIRRHFIDFFESERYEEKYHERIHEMMSAARSRLLLDMGDLLDFVPASAGFDGSGTAAGAVPASLGVGIVREPGKFVPLLELALHDVVLRQQPEYLKVDYRSRAVHVGFEGPVGTVLSPRELYARHLNTMVALEGIITRQSSNRPRVLESVHYCPETNKFTRKEFRDQFTPMIDSTHLPTVNVMPKMDMEGHLLRTELGLSTFMDSQCAILQEAPERAPTGQLPRTVELRFDDDLVDVVKPGDRVMLVGVYMAYTTADSKSFQSIVLVNHVVSVQAFTMYRRVMAVEEKLLSFAKKCTQTDGPAGVLEALSKAVAPTIYGMANEKKAVLLLMVGGVERQAHQSRVRGDINVLLVGEPSTAKSQLLRFVIGVAPLALSTTGKGSSGVGLTAAVSVDSYTGERSLSAGAMVLADRGILCIDEFDKMSPQDRVAMHEAMEQQTVTIAKAGIHASLNARCSVLAAANPIYGFYSVHHRLAFNVGLPESLLSRFDLTFIVLDKHSSEYNRRIGRHILRNHMTAAPVGIDQSVTKTVVDSLDSVWAQSAKNGGGGSGGMDLRMTTTSTGEPIVGVDFLRAYVQLAKEGRPLLTEASQQLVSQHYVQLRAEQQEGSKDGFYVTARTLEAIVRLSTAHAKLRLSSTVDEEDVKNAMELLRASVHAASTASLQRREDNQAAAVESRPGQKRPAEMIRDGANGRTPEETKDGATPSAMMEGDITTQLLEKRVTEAIRAMQREQRPSVRLAELHEKIGGGFSLENLRQIVLQLQDENFVFEGSANDGWIQFI
ncbi:minichromosome maintenance (MCM) complex subunit, putative [Trypanosoma cruzi]|uniref:DNA replication licensing factor MCM3 n=2 Tax=Trypanosoma cruzi TaxID=5693 RepID=Q4DFM7_TRYCC|nr:minichromosome maintenance (MCM) complex subunit, putative [Trypanosoma cruzi]EAN91333.1 minichromosome maintenance (MCM) complex subunit, putative [Trypanosoma cruzi]|eukprot:XP_813184.1 minichromosome maintenance (MCM) complex subunit [Trypanosoma cruzi strain CL Brener]